MLLRQCLKAVVDLLPLFSAGDRTQRRQRQFQGEVARLVVADVDDAAVGVAIRIHARAADQEPRRILDRLLRRRQADAGGAPADQGIQAFQRQRQVAAALAGQQRMDLVDDDRAHGRQHHPPRFRAQQHVQRFRRGHQDMRRPLAQGRAFGLRGVAGAHRCAHVDVGQAQPGQLLANAGQRRDQVQVDVVRQRLQRRDVEHQGGFRQAMRQPFAHQRVDRGEEGGQGLAGTGGRGNEGVATGGDRRPRLVLGLGRRRERPRKPARNRGMERVQRRVIGRARRHAGIIRAVGPVALNAIGGGAEIEADLRVHRQSLRGRRRRR